MAGRSNWLGQLRQEARQPGAGGSSALSEYRRPGINRDSYPGEDSAVCVLGGCTLAPGWRFMLGCPSEHVARLCLCEKCAVAATVYNVVCTKCGKQMNIEVREKMST